VAGYSGRPLADKLGIRPGLRLVLLNAPDGFDATLGSLPERVTVSRRLGPGTDLAVVFTTRRAELNRRWGALAAATTVGGAVWVAWPKRSAVKALGLVSDMSEDVVREVVLPTGWVDVKVCAIDEVWSGLKCVQRVEFRSAGRPAGAG